MWLHENVSLTSTVHVEAGYNTALKRVTVSGRKLWNRVGVLCGLHVLWIVSSRLIDVDYFVVRDSFQIVDMFCVHPVRLFRKSRCHPNRSCLYLKQGCIVVVLVLNFSVLSRSRHHSSYLQPWHRTKTAIWWNLVKVHSSVSTFCWHRIRSLAFY